MNVTWHDRDALFPAAVERLEATPVVLDIGCGIRPQAYVSPIVHICCEPYHEYVEHLRGVVEAKQDRHFVILQAGWAEAVAMFPPRSVDTVFLVDVIEHLDKEEGHALLKATERIARRQIAIFTPLGFMPQEHHDGKDAWGLSGGAWQEHKSGWEPEDFGDTWDILACEAFHLEDSQGQRLDPGHGALWAIKTMPAEAETPDKTDLLVMLEAANRIREARTTTEMGDAMFGALKTMLAMNAHLGATDTQLWQAGHITKQLLGLENPRFGNLAIRGLDKALLLEEYLRRDKPPTP